MIVLRKVVFIGPIKASGRVAPTANSLSISFEVGKLIEKIKILIANVQTLLKVFLYLFHLLNHLYCNYY